MKIQNETMTFDQLMERIKPEDGGIVVRDLELIDCTIIGTPENVITYVPYEVEFEDWPWRWLNRFLGQRCYITVFAERFILMNATIMGCNFVAPKKV